jgi:hypothetical protein
MKAPSRNRLIQPVNIDTMIPRGRWDSPRTRMAVVQREAALFERVLPAPPRNVLADAGLTVNQPVPLLLFPRQALRKDPGEQSKAQPDLP